MEDGLEGAVLEEGGCCRAQGDTEGSARQRGTLRDRDQCRDPKGTEGGERVQHQDQGPTLGEKVNDGMNGILTSLASHLS